MDMRTELNTEQPLPPPLQDTKDLQMVLKIENLTRRFGSVTALDKVNIHIRRGEFVAIMGPSGSGKTTLLNILSCLDTVTGGSYVLDDADTSTLTEHQSAVIRREKIGLIFQQFHLIPYLNALENVMLAQHYHSVVDKQEATQTLETVGLGHRLDHLPSQLSGGEQQRVCIARALINQPAIILADEPTGNLDEQNEVAIMELFDKLHQQGRTIILVTHNPEMAANAERIIWLRHGSVAEENLNA